MPHPHFFVPLDNSFFWGMVAAGHCYFDQVAAEWANVAIVGISGVRPDWGGVEGMAGEAFRVPRVMFV